MAQTAFIVRMDSQVKKDFDSLCNVFGMSTTTAINIFAKMVINVIVSALYSAKADAATVLILDYLTRGKLIPLVNQEILLEYKEVLSRKKFNFSSEKVAEWLHFFNEYGIQTIRSESQESFTDEKDVVFYEIALSVDGSFLVTGNTKHFPKTPIVVTPAEMIQILLKLEGKE